VPDSGETAAAWSNGGSPGQHRADSASHLPLCEQHADGASRTPPVKHRGDNTRRVRLGNDGGRIVLLVQGVVQSVAVEGPYAREGYWGQMLPDVRPTRALILGYGGGTLGHLLRERFGPVQVVGVDDDNEVLSLAHSLCGVLPHLELVRADAFTYVKQARGPFDYVALDLFRGGEIPRGVFAGPFLRQLRGLLAPHAPSSSTSSTTAAPRAASRACNRSSASANSAPSAKTSSSSASSASGTDDSFVASRSASALLGRTQAQGEAMSKKDAT
jgi:spermidine synthase